MSASHAQIALPDSPCERRVQMLLDALELDGAAPDDAQRCIDEGWVAPPTDAAEQNRIGCAYARRREWDDASDWVKQSAGSLNPDLSARARRNLKRVLLAAEAAR